MPESVSTSAKTATAVLLALAGAAAVLAGGSLEPSAHATVALPAPAAGVLSDALEGHDVTASIGSWY